MGLTYGPLKDYHDERSRAMAKHGFARTPANPEMGNGERLIILAEEFGEVARALTYDEGNRDELRKELVQLGTMAFMWVEGLDNGTE